MTARRPPTWALLFPNLKVRCDGCGRLVPIGVKFYGRYRLRTLKRDPGPDAFTDRKVDPAEPRDRLRRKRGKRAESMFPRVAHNEA